jgi:hypothetical protein
MGGSGQYGAFGGAEVTKYCGRPWKVRYWFPSFGMTFAYDKCGKGAGESGRKP